MIGGEFVLITACLASMLATQAHCSCICDCSSPFLYQIPKFIGSYPHGIHMAQNHPQRFHQFHQNKEVPYFIQQQMGFHERDLGMKPEMKPAMKNMMMKPMVKPIVKPEMKPMMKPMAKPEMKPEMKLEMMFAMKPEMKPEMRPGMKLEMKPQQYQYYEQPKQHSLFPAGTQELSNCAEEAEAGNGGMGGDNGAPKDSDDKGMKGGDSSRIQLQEKKDEKSHGTKIPMITTSKDDGSKNSQMQASPIGKPKEIPKKESLVKEGEKSNKEDEDYHHEHYQHHEHDKNVYYKFAYSVNDKKTHDVKYQREERKGDVVKGEYALMEEDGNVRTVKYVADWKNGFMAQVLNSKKGIASFT